MLRKSVRLSPPHVVTPGEWYARFDIGHADQLRRRDREAPATLPRTSDVPIVAVQCDGDAMLPFLVALVAQGGDRV